MSTSPVMSPSGAPRWGSLAVVTYLPPPLGSFLTTLRGVLKQDGAPAAHITFLPPRELTLPFEEASAEIGRRLAAAPPFEVELGEIQVFPVTNMLYLDIKAGSSQLASLHAALNAGNLHARENFEFTPHLTVSNPLVSADVAEALQRARAAWAKCPFPSRFLVNELVLLWQPGYCTEKHWVRQSTVPLGCSA